MEISLGSNYKSKVSFRIKHIIDVIFRMINRSHVFDYMLMKNLLNDLNETYDLVKKNEDKNMKSKGGEHKTKNGVLYKDLNEIYQSMFNHLKHFLNSLLKELKTKVSFYIILEK